MGCAETRTAVPCAIPQETWENAVTLPQEQRPDLGHDQRATHDAVIREQVLHALGRPVDLLQVPVRPLWGRYYRVNVLVGPDVASARVARSFFVTVDGDGSIVTSDPAISKQY